MQRRAVSRWEVAQSNRICRGGDWRETWPASRPLHARFGRPRRLTARAEQPHSTTSRSDWVEIRRRTIRWALVLKRPRGWGSLDARQGEVKRFFGRLTGKNRRKRQEFPPATPFPSTDESENGGTPPLPECLVVLFHFQGGLSLKVQTTPPPSNRTTPRTTPRWRRRHPPFGASA